MVQVIGGIYVYVLRNRLRMLPHLPVRFPALAHHPVGNIVHAVLRRVRSDILQERVILELGGRFGEVLRELENLFPLQLCHDVAQNVLVPRRAADDVPELTGKFIWIKTGILYCFGRHKLFLSEKLFLVGSSRHRFMAKVHSWAQIHPHHHQRCYHW